MNRPRKEGTVSSEFWRLSSCQRHLVADSTVGRVARYALARERLDPSRRFRHRALSESGSTTVHLPRSACATRPAFSRRLSDDTVELRGRPFIRMISVKRAHGFARQRQWRLIMGQFLLLTRPWLQRLARMPHAARDEELPMIQEWCYRDLRAVAHRRGLYRLHREHSSGAATIADRAFLGKGVEKVRRTGSKP